MKTFIQGHDRISPHEEYVNSWPHFFSFSMVTTENYEAILDAWLGSSENALIDSWGVPAQIYHNNGAKYLIYAKSRLGYVTFQE